MTIVITHTLFGDYRIGQTVRCTKIAKPLEVLNSNSFLFLLIDPTATGQAKHKDH